MSSCLSGGRTYRFDPEIPSLLCHIPKAPSSSSNRSQSPSSSFSESSNSPLSISTKKTRTPRKRPNEAYNEAAALLSTVYPNIFSTKNFKSLCNKHTKVLKFFDESSSELLPPFPAMADSGFLLHPPEKPTIRIEPKPMNSCRSPVNDQCRSNLRQSFPVEFEDGFDTESLLDQETEQGIDIIIGNSSNSSSKDYDSNDDNEKNNWVFDNLNGGLGFGGNPSFEFESAGKFKALRHMDDGDWCRFPTVEILEIMPKLKVSEKEEKEKFRQGLSLKLNYDEVLNVWSDRGSPFSDDVLAPGSPESSSDTIARLMQLDLFPELGNWRTQMDENGVREASVLRYKEKRRTRLFSKKIRYQVRKVNADRRPRMKGRFVRRPALQH